RVYNEIHRADWWWETQDLVPRGGTLVPLLFTFDKTHLTNFSGDKAAWLVYMSIGKICKDLQRRRSKRAWVLVAFLPISPKNPKDGKIHSILKPIAELDIAGPGYEFYCVDGQVCRYYPILAAWVADYPEHVILARIIKELCPICEIPLTEMGHEPSSRVRGDLASLGLWAEENPFSRLPLCNVYRLWQPDTLHLLHLGILKMMMDWLVGYLRQWGILGLFNDDFKSIPPYPGFQPFKRSYEEVSSWQGKEIRTMMRFLLAVLGLMLIDKVRSIESEEAQVVTCVKSITEFLIVLGQRSHSDYTLGLLDNELAILYRSKSVFQKLETAIYHFRFPKMDMLSHTSNSIRRMGSPDNFSTNISDLLHIENVKEVYRASSRVQYEEQMLWYNDRHTWIAYMVQTLQYLALSGMYDHDTARALGIHTRKEKLLSTRHMRLQERGARVYQQAFRTTSRPNQNLAHVISLEI
ncbi:hypothetical protein HOY82DRAFT_493442, partial [Tuber indicum]